MAGRKTILTPAIQARIVAYIRSGAYDWVAAQACGITPRTFYNWIGWGERNPEGPFFLFFQEVTQARAEARVLAETEVRKGNPLAWLRYGPGREKKGQPGWTESHEFTGPEGEKLEFTLKLGEKVKDDDSS